jgi:hypothetical protein
METDTQPEYRDALCHMAEKRVQALLSNGGQLSPALTEFVSRCLGSMPSEIILAAAKEHDLLKKHTHRMPPALKGLYLKLLHGRASPDCEMEDWGSDGPWIGPLESFHCIYSAEVGMTFVGGEELSPMSPNETVVPPLYVYGQLVYHDGIYYGDFELRNL